MSERLKLGREIHEVYLRAVNDLDPVDYNKKAVIPFEKLTPGQQQIDLYLADWVIARESRILAPLRAYQDRAYVDYKECSDTAINAISEALAIAEGKAEEKQERSTLVSDWFIKHYPTKPTEGGE